MDGKEWGRFPPQSWFDDTPWNFFDVAIEDGKLKAVPVDPQPRKYYFDYRALDISFKSEDLSKTPLSLPDPIPPRAPPAAATLVGSLAAPTLVTTFMPERVAVARPETALVKPLVMLESDKSESRTFMRISGIKLTGIQTTGFEVYLTDDAGAQLMRSSPGFVGTIALFRHDAPVDGVMAGMQHESYDVFDVTRALKNSSQADPGRLHVVIKPFSLADARTSNAQLIEAGSLAFDGVEFFTR
ncbi:hypothetical protein [Mesorhizobium sp.]|uniref:hypothetical protein n=1 Tax=Mesorhizobium sp. TaxID=1871066 RepID=UPI0025ECE304|nr:hypothetical protein [Mesorhizobium sp.]